MPHYFFDIRDGHGPWTETDPIAKQEGSRLRRFTQQTGGQSDAPHFRSECG